MKRDLQQLAMSSASREAGDAVLVALMERIGQGDRMAFRELYSLTSHRLLASARRLVGNPTMAEDVVQETYMRVWRYSRSYRPETSAPLTWITQILRNRAIDLRAFGRKEEVPLAEEAEDGDEHETAPLNMAAEKPTIDPRLAACFALLDGPHRQVLSLAYHQGMSHAEIAQHLGVPLGTAKTWVRRAMQALRASVEGAAPQGLAQDDEKEPT